MVTEDAVFDAVKEIIDPEVGINIVDMGLIYGVDIEDETVNITMTLTSPGCPAGGQLINGTQHVTQQLEGVDEVNINVVWTPRWTPEMMTEEAKDELGIFKPVAMRQQQPKTIKRLGNDGLQIVWKDGHESEYAYPYLRRMCPCAECSTIRHRGQDVHSLFGPDGLGDPDQIFVPTDTRPLNLELVGRYAIQFTWSDGHSTGIYSFETLRGICPCSQCISNDERNI